MTDHKPTSGTSHGSVDKSGNCDGCGADGLDPKTGTYGSKGGKGSGKGK